MYREFFWLTFDVNDAQMTSCTSKARWRCKISHTCGHAFTHPCLWLEMVQFQVSSREFSHLRVVHRRLQYETASPGDLPCACVHFRCAGKYPTDFKSSYEKKPRRGSRDHRHTLGILYYYHYVFCHVLFKPNKSDVVIIWLWLIHATVRKDEV